MTKLENYSELKPNTAKFGLTPADLKPAAKSDLPSTDLKPTDLRQAGITTNSHLPVLKPSESTCSL